MAETKIDAAIIKLARVGLATMLDKAAQRDAEKHDGRHGPTQTVGDEYYKRDAVDAPNAEWSDKPESQDEDEYHYEPGGDSTKGSSERVDKIVQKLAKVGLVVLLEREGSLKKEAMDKEAVNKKLLAGIAAALGLGGAAYAGSEGVLGDDVHGLLNRSFEPSKSTGIPGEKGKGYNDTNSPLRSAVHNVLRAQGKLEGISSATSSQTNKLTDIANEIYPGANFNTPYTTMSEGALNNAFMDMITNWKEERNLRARAGI